MTIVTLGRQPKIGLAELEALYGTANITPISKYVVGVSVKVDHKRLGGVIRTGNLIQSIPTNSPQSRLIEILTEYAIKNHKYGKTSIGISYFDGKFNSSNKNLVLELKKSLKSKGFSIRAVFGKNTELNAAEVLYNKLAGHKNFEFCLTQNEKELIIFLTNSIQDIDAYAARDHGRPKRDARVGMLPPKLAQTMINLTSPKENQNLLDPFCGTGVILQEALLMGFKVYGSDLEKRMIDYTNQNLIWASQKYNFDLSRSGLETADARRHTWPQPIDIVVSETYLGPPLSHLPHGDKLKEIVTDVDNLLRAALSNLHRQTKSGTKLCLAVPAWRQENNLKHLPLVDQIEDLGYTRQVFKHATFDDMVYSRPNQIVARELLVLIRK